MRATLGVLLAVCAAGVDVRVSGDHKIDIEARAAPFSAVLECLADRTGMKVVNERGPAPRTPVTLTLRDRTEVEALHSLLEGLGLNYAMAMDPTGSRVQVLLLSGASGTGPRVAAPPQPPPAPEPEPTPIPEEPQQIVPPSAEPTNPINPQMSPWPGAPAFPGAPPQWPPGFPQPGSSSPQPNLFPEQRPLSPLSLRDGGRVGVSQSSMAENVRTR